MTQFQTSPHARTLARRSMTLVRAVARAAGEGLHHLTVIALSPRGAAEAECLITGPVPNEDDPTDPLAYVAYLLATTTMGAKAMLAARTLHPQCEVTYMSWAVSDLVAHPATAEESIVAYCLGENRDITDPVPGVTFMDAPALD